MGPDSVEYAIRAATFVGAELGAQQLEMLTRFREWLEIEAIPAGGVGPNEATRLWRRHIADSVLFELALGEDTRECADLGSGAGLPGVVLAIVREDISFSLVDKSARRCEMLDRILSVLRLDNCTVIHSELKAVDRKWDAIVSRAAMPLEGLLFHVKRLLAGGGVAVIGLTRSSNSASPVVPETPGLETEIIEISRDILDSPAKLLRIAAN